ncbi:putative reverse transcriptase domain-containing protein [Tanacetum coccineum]|uniref:Reverse transcriptase domain-containing protein n=1 Tax=Tanacetum coccineum TaxID=301880 RepID=A0ABQ5BE75_9ASTR
MNMILQSSIKDRILAAQKEAVNESAGLQKGLDEMIKLRNDGALYYLDRIWVPLKGLVAHASTARVRAFMLGAEEARQDPNIVTSTFTLNSHFATTLFDFGADYSFVSSTFIPLLGLEPSDLGFKYEIEIPSGELVEIDKIIKGCKLEIEGHDFDIDLIPFGHGSFDVIIGMDWLSKYKAEIICHEKVVRIPLPDGKVLTVLGKRPEEKAKLLMSAKASDKKQEEIVVVRDFPESHYHLAPSELEELSGQLKELQDKGAKGLTSPEQTATGKGISNPFMAVMVCQKPYGIQLTNVSRVNTPGSDENRLKLYDLMYKIVNGADTKDC